jgi:DNA-binding transcriptional regulator YdaS (Cro superfamily)
MDKTPIQTAVAIVGGQSSLARAIKVTQGMVWQWCANIRPVAPGRCIDIERATDGAVTRFDLRPDVFGEAPDVDQREAG